jgi:sugar-phosphatase
MGLASSSPVRLIDVVVDQLNIRSYFYRIASAEKLPYGKPHPQVFIDCADALSVRPDQCLVFEDSFNGLIAAKAAKMKCVVVPARGTHAQMKWNAADHVLTSLVEWDEATLQKIVNSAS